jgi:hypothetical protein
MANNQNGGELQPLQQTIFETGPKASFTPPEVQNVYQEGRTIFANQPVTVSDDSANWYALGRNAFNIANETFGNVIDYMIQTKANTVRDLKDIYQTKINEEYDKLQAVQNMVSNKNTENPEQYTPTMNSLIENVRQYRNEWRDKVSVAIENDKGSLFSPKINYWDDNLDMKNLGSRYQELAVEVRKADRDISTVIRRTEWDAATTTVGNAKNLEDLEAIHAGQMPFNNTGTYDSLSQGKLPLPQGDDNFPVRDTNGIPFGHEVDVNGAITVAKDERGQEVLFKAEDGSYRINPNAGWSWIKTPEQAQSWVTLANSYPHPDAKNKTFMFTADGRLEPETRNRIKLAMEKSPTTANPGELYMVGAVLAAVPQESVASNLKESGLNADQQNKAALITEIVKSGGGFQAIADIRGIQPKSVTEVTNYVNSLSGNAMLVRGVTPDNTYGINNDARIMNTYLTSVVAAAMGISEQDLPAFKAKYAVVAGTDSKGAPFGIRDADSSDKVSLGTLLETRPDIKASVTHAMAWLHSNIPAAMGGKNEIDETALAGLAKDFTEHHMALTGYHTFVESDGTQVTVRNNNYGYMQQFVGNDAAKRQQNQQEFMAGALQTTDLYTELRGSTEGPPPAEQLGAWAKAIVPSVNTQDFIAMTEALRVIQSNDNGINSSSVITPDIALPLAVACSPDIQRKYGFTFTPESTTEERMVAIKTILDDLAPVSEWGIAPNNSENYQAWSSSPRGGIGLSISSFKSKTHGDLMRETIPATSITPKGYLPIMQGAPALSIPAYAPQDTQAKLFSNSVARNKIATLNGKTGIRVAYSDNAPMANLTTDEVIHNASFIAGEEVARQLRFASSQPITDAVSALNDLRINSPVIINAAKQDPSLAPVVPLLQAEFGVGGTKKLFNEENMAKILKEAQSKGAKNMADVYSYIIGIAKERHLNVKNNNMFFAMMAKRESEITGVPIHSTDFIIPSGSRAGMVMQTPDSPDYYAKLQTAAASGYTIYRDPTENTLYVSNGEVPTTIIGDKPMPVLVPAKKQGETDADFAQRFNTVFSAQMKRQTMQPAIREALKSFVDAEYFDYSAKRSDTTVLPSSRQEQFANEYSDFRKRLKLDMPTVSPADALIASTYDWQGYWMENKSFPSTLQNLPTKYALPIKESPIPEKAAVTNVRKLYSISINQQDMNKALLVFNDQYLPSESSTFKDTDIQRVAAFKKAGWSPAAFEYQVRVMAAKRDETNLAKIIYDDLRPNKFFLDQPLKNKMEDDFRLVLKDMEKTLPQILSPAEINKAILQMPKETTAAQKKAEFQRLEQIAVSPPHKKYGELRDKFYTKFLNDPTFAVQVKQQYLLEWLSPAGVANDATSADRRRAFLLQALQE